MVHGMMILILISQNYMYQHQHKKDSIKCKGIPTESNGEPKYSELYDDDLYAVQEIQESPIPDQVDVYDHDTFLPVKYDEIVPDDFSYRPSTWGESKANESDTFLPRSDPLFSDERNCWWYKKTLRYSRLLPR